MADLLILEPFYGGSHKQLIDVLTSRLEPDSYVLVSLPAKKWHWRARTSSLKLSQDIPREHSFKTLFASSVLSLSELLGLRPDLVSLRKIVYFHENQLCYPVQTVKERDFQFGYNQITSCLSADLILFNSQYNLTSFLSCLPSFLGLQPDFKPNTKQIVEQIRARSQVSYFPLQLPKLPQGTVRKPESRVLHIVWPHRWEHDKNPELFCRVVTKLGQEGFNFQLSLLGEVYGEVPEIISQLKERLRDKIVAFGFLPDKDKYFELLHSADVVVSTASHEFYGVSMLEAAWCGCYPLAPNALVYPEIYPAECLYNTEQQLYKRLAKMCQNLGEVEVSELRIEYDKFTGGKPLNKLLDHLTSSER